MYTCVYSGCSLSVRTEVEMGKSVNVWQSYKQERDCLVHCVRLVNALLKDEKSYFIFADLIFFHSHTQQ